MRARDDLAPFRIRAYGRTELAEAYSPGITPEAAWRKLRRWIRRVPGLEERIGGLGAGRPRHFSPAAVRSIVEALGEP